MATKTQILKGRQAVDAYREAHRLLHEKPYYKGIHDDHTPLLGKMLAGLKKQKFNSLQEFFDASNEQNLVDAKLVGKIDLTEAESLILEGMWK